MTLSADEHDELCRLEESLWRAETRFDRDHMNEVLAPDFFEFGQSGRVYRREDTLDVPAQSINATLPLAKFINCSRCRSRDLCERGNLRGGQGGREPKLGVVTRCRRMEDQVSSRHAGVRSLGADGGRSCRVVVRGAGWVRVDASDAVEK
jgi:hypothetical protein